LGLDIPSISKSTKPFTSAPLSITSLLDAVGLKSNGALTKFGLPV
jgi:hypothetical protein